VVQYDSDALLSGIHHPQMFKAQGSMPVLRGLAGGSRLYMVECTLKWNLPSV